MCVRVPAQSNTDEDNCISTDQKLLGEINIFFLKKASHFVEPQSSFNLSNRMDEVIYTAINSK